jgi:putative ABC transport system permease protein
MNVATRGIRNAFRNAVRTLSIVIILGLSIGLSLVMLIAHQAVGNKIESVKRSIGNTITIRPAAYNGFSQANNALTNTQIDGVKSLPHVIKIIENLNSNLVTAGSSAAATAAPSSATGDEKSSGTAATTSLKSPVQLDKDDNGVSGGGLALNGISKVSDNFSPPISVLGTTNPAGTIADVDAKITITQGKTIDGTKDTKDTLISKSMSSKNSLIVGSTYTAYDETLTVAGIFTSDTQAGENFVIMSLPTLQRLSGNTDVITEAIATADSVANIQSTTDAIKKTLGSNADVTNSEKSVQDAIKPLQSIQGISLYSLIGSVTAGGLIILLSMIMIVRERKREIGVFKAIGFSNIRIMLQFMVEALTLTALSAVIGLIIGVAAGSPVTKTLISNSANGSNSSNSSMPQILKRNQTVKGITDVQAEIGWEVILEGFGAAVAIALFGSAVASFFIAKVKPAEVLRSE